ncbi:hypothetical protein PsorP6_012884 [Peronosclerospora sorghi]|uniref:Uncharacterized protein n=1 Tax=Peronosclerospora sorghi TaxID=230839 RepID=A0ACC0WGN1_9STRA|nr:hypothetical protein PsorP6_012884 [Peronosclerospora sorghi]
MALVAKTQLAVHERYLFPLIIYTLHDRSSSEKRQVALQTLGQLAGSTGCVVRPYLASPKLLETFLSLLHHKVGSPWSSRCSSGSKMDHQVGPLRVGTKS